jgi:hypothetical protein
MMSAPSCPPMEPASTIITSMVFPRERSEAGFCRYLLLGRLNESRRPAF